MSRIELPRVDHLDLDPSLYNLKADEVTFYKQQKGIQDDEELKQHIIEVQKEAYAIFPFPCISSFNFTRLKISRLPAYPQALKLGKERPGAILLDIGCCFGNDVYKAVADGYPVENIVTSDLHQVSQDSGTPGSKLFKRTNETAVISFIPGDVFDPTHLEPIPPFTAASPPASPRPILQAVTSLNPLRGHVSIIHASALFHLFPEDRQLQLARALASLLSPEPGSMIFGQHSGVPDEAKDISVIGVMIFCHSPASWAALWDGVVFEKGTVRVETEVQEIDREDVRREAGDTKPHWLNWSVIRL